MSQQLESLVSWVRENLWPVEPIGGEDVVCVTMRGFWDLALFHIPDLIVFLFQQARFVAV